MQQYSTRQLKNLSLVGLHNNKYKMTDKSNFVTIIDMTNLNMRLNVAVPLVEQERGVLINRWLSLFVFQRCRKRRRLTLRPGFPEGPADPIGPRGPCGKEEGVWGGGADRKENYDQAECCRIRAMRLCGHAISVNIGCVDLRHEVYCKLLAL